MSRRRGLMSVVDPGFGPAARRTRKSERAFGETGSEADNTTSKTSETHYNDSVLRGLARA